jgi:hypothetical protein
MKTWIFWRMAGCLKVVLELHHGTGALACRLFTQGIGAQWRPIVQVEELGEAPLGWSPLIALELDVP